MVYLLINNNKTLPDGQPGILRPFREQFRLLPTMKRALEEAVKLGWEDFLRTGVTDKMGIKNQYCCGEVDLAILPLDTEP